MYHVSLDRVMTAEKEFLDGLRERKRKHFRMPRKHTERRDFDTGESFIRRPAQTGIVLKSLQRILVKSKLTVSNWGLMKWTLSSYFKKARSLSRNPKKVPITATTITTNTQ